MDEEEIEWICDETPSTEPPKPSESAVTIEFVPPTPTNPAPPPQTVPDSSTSKKSPTPEVEVPVVHLDETDIPVEHLDQKPTTTEPEPPTEAKLEEPPQPLQRKESEPKVEIPVEHLDETDIPVQHLDEADIPVQHFDEPKKEQAPNAVTFEFSKDPPAQPAQPPPRPKTPDFVEFTIQDASKSRDDKTIDQLTDDEGLSQLSQGFDLDGYEKQLNANTAETQKLLDEIDQKSAKISEINASVANGIAAQRDFLNSYDRHKTIEDSKQVPVRSELPTGSLPPNVDSIIIGEGQLTAVDGMAFLPNGTLVVADGDYLVLFDLVGNLLTRMRLPEWTHVRSPIFHKDHVLILVDWESEGKTKRYIVKLTLALEYVARIEGPKWLEDRHVVRDRISIAHTDFIYFVAAGEIASMLCELSPEGQWTELDFKQSEKFNDVVAFATIGPITQLLVLEGVRNYVYQISVRESEVVDRRKMAICERPGAMARDESGRLFVVNKSSACVTLVDTIRWVSAKSVSIIDGAAPTLAASWGLLAVPGRDYIRLQRYSFR